MQSFYSNGKLLLSGEYLILDGARGLALPTIFGQDLIVEPSDQKDTLHWKSLDQDNTVWFEGLFNLTTLEPLELKGEEKTAKTLVKILQQAKITNPNFLSQIEGIKVRTKLSFPRNWGLGSSSTLINNIAQWAQIDAFELLFSSFGGSGYDIACAQNNHAIIYNLNQGIPFVEQIDFNPNFKDQLYFVHLNKKQVSSESIKAYRKTVTDSRVHHRISELTEQLILANNLVSFEKILYEHENLLASVLKEKTVQEKYFSDFKGQTKSLGAWGGDFILATGDKGTTDYFNQKGYATVIPYESMIKKYEKS